MTALAFGLAALPASAETAKFSVTSPTFKAGKTLPVEHVFKGFGCEGGNVSPAITWKGAPADTKSFAVTIYDPDAPTGSGWWHWTVFNIPAAATKLEAGAGNAEGKGLPAGAQQGRTDFGSAAFGGACPPKGDKPHRYILTVFALKADKIPLDANASGALVGFYLNANALAKARITTTYGR
ncbi:MAG: kinase inhibitor [Ferrovibrio sp.]